MTVTPKEANDAANDLYGLHPGSRTLHAKGTLLRGTFTATPDAAKLTTAAHMQGEPVPATVRVSNGGGDPNIPDYAQDVRGLAVKMYLPDGSRTDIVTQTVPRFPFKSPDGFVALLRAQSSGIHRSWKLPLVFVRHPEALKSAPSNLPTLKPPTSYATTRYFAIHAFRFIDAQGQARHVRYTLVPEVEEPRLSGGAAKQKGRDYLQEEIRQRIAQGPVRFTLELQIAGPGDDPDDPSAVWPDDRERVTAGTLEITDLETEREKPGDILVFDPTRVPAGIELSGDPVLNFRRSAYSDSVARRTA